MAKSTKFKVHSSSIFHTSSLLNNTPFALALLNLTLHFTHSSLTDHGWTAEQETCQKVNGCSNVSHSTQMNICNIKYKDHDDDKLTASESSESEVEVKKQQHTNKNKKKQPVQKKHAPSDSKDDSSNEQVVPNKKKHGLQQKQVQKVRE
jgi:hypothetical protein